MPAFTPNLALKERTTHEKIWEVSSVFENETLLRQFLDAIPDVVMVLNMNRQVVFANRALLDLLQVDDFNVVYGLRPGEILGCIHSDESGDGCGTTGYCRACGAMSAILQSQQGKADMQEFRLTRRMTSEALDFRVHTTPLYHLDQNFTIFSVSDIADEKRRRALERIFFHDVLNTAGGLRSYAELMKSAPLEDLEEIRTTLLSLSKQLIAEIQAQKNLAAAENSELIVFPAPLDSSHIMREVATFYDEMAAEADKHIVIDVRSDTVAFVSDEVQLVRVLGNLVKNALEAVKPQQSITIGCRLVEKEVEFWVHNPATMPVYAQLQVFQRSFSTKGDGRGLGTYSVKLLTERYLQGTVSFTSEQRKGTTFRIRLPRALKVE